MKKIILFLIVLLIVPLALAVPPTQVFGGDAGLEIIVPPFEFLQLSNPLQFNTHVYNTSGLSLDNSTTSCLLHLFNSTGFHTLHENLEYNDIVGDFQLNISGNNFTRLGFYSYVIECNDTAGEGGFVAGVVKVTEDGGDDNPVSDSSSLAIVFFILIVTGGVFAMAMKKDLFKNEFLNLTVKRCLVVFGIYLMILNSAIVGTVAQTANIPLTHEMIRYMWLFSLAGRIFMLILAFGTLLQLLKMWKVKKQERRYGDNE